MTDQWNAQAASDVKLDLSRLRGEPSGTDTRYTVALVGPVGEQWAETYKTVQTESTAHRRFELDPAKATIRFSCRTVDGTGLVFEVLERLEALVERVNQVVSMRGTAGPRISLSSASLRPR